MLGKSLPLRGGGTFGSLLNTGVVAVFHSEQGWKASKLTYGKPQQFPLSALFEALPGKNLSLRFVFENQEAIDLFLTDTAPEVLPFKQWATMARAAGDYLILTADELIGRCATMGPVQMLGTGWWVEDLRTATIPQYSISKYEYSSMHLWSRANFNKTHQALKKPIALFSLCEGLSYIRSLEAAIAGENTDLEYTTTRVTTDQSFSGFILSKPAKNFAYVVPLTKEIPPLKFISNKLVGDKDAIRKIYRRGQADKLITFEAKLFPDEVQCGNNFAQHYKRDMLNPGRVLPLDVLTAGGIAELS